MSEEDPISTFCNSLSSFCNRLHSSTTALKQSIHRRPIPLDSASSTFVQCLNRRVSTATADLDMLDSMSFGTVSFEELLGHCNELYKKHQNDLVEIEDRLKSYGYVPLADVEEEEEEEEEDAEDRVLEGKFDCASSLYGSLSVADSAFKSFEEEEEEDDLLDESLSLKKLGLSDACLATLASEVSSPDAAGLSIQEPKNNINLLETKWWQLKEQSSHHPGNTNLESAKCPSSVLKIVESEFERLPGYIKGLASFEDLLVAVDKVNSRLSKKTDGKNFFRQDEIPSFDLGPKARSYLLLLVRMNRLVVETIDGLISYRIL
ncbi:hypothetical protein RIF29_39546 [Crotalaria pallida]|uniref:Spindle and kinetochore-associated protein 3 n=1 Tax=Crotalaria pallida TaxID=3830 RepID=A0AAN9E6U0_CROPI